ncbi:MAG: magnesium transporter [Gemmatimonadota bacterium]
MAAELVRDEAHRLELLTARAEAGDDAGVVELLAALHPSDIADLLESIAPEALQLAIVRALPAELASEALAEMEEGDERAELLAALAPERGAALIQELEVDDAADLIGELDPPEQDRILAELPADDAGELRDLLRYGEETAGGLMTTDLVAILSTLNAGEAIAEVRRQGQEVGDFYAVFVVDGQHQLLGTVPLNDLILADPGVRVSELVVPVPIEVEADTDQEEVGRLMARYNLVSVPVVDAGRHLLGRITFDDVLDVLEAEQTEDLLRLAGVGDEEEVRGGWVDAVRSRAPWLGLNLLTASIAASVIWMFADTVEGDVALIFVMPIIAALGGNAGVQSLAVTLRRITLAEGDMGERPWSAVGKEVLVGLANGALIGGIAATLGTVLFGQPRLGLVVLLAMWGNLVVASFAGAFVPTFLSRVGLDPAVASSVFVQTFTDLCGFLLLLGLATALLL